jgi:hypothetical protein
MTASVWVVKGFLVAVIAGIPTVQADPGGNPGRAEPAQRTVDPATGPPNQKEREKAMVQPIVTPEARDRRYQDMLKTSDSLLAVWRQQPENTAAPNRYLEELTNRLASVRKAAASSPDSDEPKAHPQKTTSCQGRVEAPARPIKSSSKPSSQKETRWSVGRWCLAAKPRIESGSTSNDPDLSDVPFWKST